MTAAAEVTSYEVDAKGVAVLRLQRPKSRNAIDTQMLVEILQHVAVARDAVVAEDAHAALSTDRTPHFPEGRERLDEARADLEATAAGLRLPEREEDVDGPLAGICELDAVIRCAVHDHLKPLIASLRSLLHDDEERKDE